MKLIITLDITRVDDDAPKGDDLDRDIEAMLDEIVVDGYEVARKSIRRDWEKEPPDEARQAFRNLKYLIRDALAHDLRMTDPNPDGLVDLISQEPMTVAETLTFWLEGLSKFE